MPGNKHSCMEQDIWGVFCFSLRWTHISLILKHLQSYCLYICVRQSKSFEVFHWKLFNTCACREKTPHLTQFFDIVIIIIVVNIIIIIIVLWSLLLELRWCLFRSHTPVVHNVVLRQQKRAQKGLQPKWNVLPHIHAVEQISGIIPSVTHVVGLCSKGRGFFSVPVKYIYTEDNQECFLPVAMAPQRLLRQRGSRIPEQVQKLSMVRWQKLSKLLC